MAGSSLRVAVEHRRDLVSVVVGGDVEDARGLDRLVGAGLAAAGRRPVLVDLTALRLRRPGIGRVFRRLLCSRAPGARTVVVARPSQRRAMAGAFGPLVGWYPAAVRSPLLGMATSLAARRGLPVEVRGASVVEDPLGELLWAAAREQARPRSAAVRRPLLRSWCRPGRRADPRAGAARPAGRGPALPGGAPRS
jgi:hypothetical protein